MNVAIAVVSHTKAIANCLVRIAKGNVDVGLQPTSGICYGPYLDKAECQCMLKLPPYLVRKPECQLLF